MLSIKTNKKKVMGKALFNVKKKFAKNLRKFEVKLAQNFRNYIEILAPDGKRQKTGKKLKSVIHDLRVRKDNDRTGVNAFFNKKKATFNLYLITNSEGESKLINWVNNGTGIYGPSGKRIKPKNSKLLSWIDDNGVRRYATSIKGQKPQKFIEEAAELLARDMNSNKISF